MFETVFSEEFTVFVLKSDFAMVFCLIREIGLHSGTMRWADGENPVAALPMKIGVVRSARFQPLGGAGLDLLN